MSKIKNGRLDQYGAEPFEQQQFGTTGVEGVSVELKGWLNYVNQWDQGASGQGKAYDHLISHFCATLLFLLQYCDKLALYLIV